MQQIFLLLQICFFVFITQVSFIYLTLLMNIVIVKNNKTNKILTMKEHKKGILIIVVDKT